MGLYINPTDGSSKEEWLHRNSTERTAFRPYTHRVGSDVVVCLVDNGFFTAAGICYTQNELEAFGYDDGRPKLWFFVPEDKLAEFMNGQEIE